MRSRIPTLEEPDRHPFSPIERAEQILAGMPQRPTTGHGGRQPYYQPAADTVTMPDRDLFGAEPEYYSTLFHELVHSTGHGSRLGRKGIESLSPFGSPTYSREELIGADLVSLAQDRLAELAGEQAQPTL